MRRSEASKRQAPSRVAELDGVRGLAAFAIAICHLPRGFWFGETAVDLFFVLSGFLITAIILENQSANRFFFAFYARRSLRIWPIYYIALACVLVLNAARTNPDSTEGWLWYALYLQNVPSYWGEPTPPVPSFGHTWTLAIEEQFYILWPPLVVALARSRRMLRVVCLALLFASIAARLGGISRVTLLGHLDGLVLGGLLAASGMRLRGASNPHRTTQIGMALALVFGICYAIMWTSLRSDDFTGKDMVQHPWAITAITLCYTGVVTALIGLRDSVWTAWLRWRPLAYLGSISYGLYLYHWIVYELLDTVFKFGMGFSDPLWLDALKLTASLAIAAASWRWIEKPILSLKRHFDYLARVPAKASST